MNVTTHPQFISAPTDIIRAHATRLAKTLPMLLAGTICAWLLYVLITGDLFRPTSTRFSAALAGVSAWIYAGIGLTNSRREIDLFTSLGFAGTLFFVAILVMEQTSAAIAPLFFVQAAWISRRLSAADTAYPALFLAWGGFNASFGILLLCEFA